tara:strand:+ start:3362 stop:4105 length:744 start_codon:yes stop_codon:yes gene_type:complete
MAKPVVFITGGGRRIGAAISTMLMEAGYFVLIHVRNSLADAQAIIDQYSNLNDGDVGGDIVQADLLNDDIINLIDTIVNHPKVVEYGGLFGLIHNASVYQPISFDELTFEEFKKNFTIHVEVPFLLTKGLYEQLKAKSGSVIGLVDTSQGRAWQDLTHYTASKNALRQMMINLAGDLQPHVRVNCIAPGAIISAAWEIEHFASVLEKVPMGRSGEPKDIASAAKFLLESDHLSGQIINVDGGWTLVE